MHQAPNPTRRWLQFSLRTIIVAVTVFHLETATRAAELTESANREYPRAVTEFCEQALLRDRGVANHPMGGSTDRQLALLIVLSDALRQRMEVTPTQAHDVMSIVDTVTLHAFGASREEFIQHAARLGIKGEPLSAEIDIAARRIPGFVDGERDDSDPSLYYDLVAQVELANILTKKQQDQLDVLYLNAEGLMASHRRHLANRLSLSTDQRARMWKVLHDSLDDDVRQWHRMHWGLLGDDVNAGPRIIRRELRHCSRQIDHRMLALLEPKQLEKLNAMLEDSVGWSKFVVPTGMDGGWTLKDIENAGK